MHEKKKKKFGVNYENANLGNKNGCYWFPYNKGGDLRRWYGNQHYVVRYENNGQELIDLVTSKYPKISDPEFVIKNRKYYFRESITWTDLTSSMLPARYQPKGSIFDGSGHSTFTADKKVQKIILAFLNSQ